MSTQTQTGTATTTLQEFTFSPVQNVFKLENKGSTDIQFNVGKYTNKTLHAYDIFEARVDYESFNVITNDGTSEFEATLTNDTVDLLEVNNTTDYNLKRNASSKNTNILLGDSLSRQVGYGNEANPEDEEDYYYNLRGFYTWGNIMLNHSFSMIKNAGVGGEKVLAMYERLQEDVIKYEPEWCHFLGGRNDVTQGTSEAEITTTINSIIEDLLSANIKVIIGTITPKTDDDATQINLVKSINGWIKEKAYNTDGVICVDYYKVIVDPLTGLGQASLLTDETHPNPKGALFMGYEFYNTLKSTVNDKEYFPLLPNINDDPSVLSANPLFLGDTLGVPDGWAKVGTALLEKVTSEDFSNSEKIRITSATGENGGITQGISALNWSEGDTVYGLIEFEIESLTEITEFFLELRSKKGADNADTATDGFIESLLEVPISGIDSFTGVLKTPSFTIPTGATSLIYTFRIYGECTIVIKNAVVRKE